MAKFSNWFHRQEKLLEKAIAGLFYDPNITFPYDFNGETKRSPAYLLPTEVYGDVMCGLFLVDNHLQEISLGLKRKQGLFSTDYYALMKQSLVSENFPNDRALYLPLVLTEGKLDINDQNDNPLKKGPFPVYGLAGTEQNYPLYLISRLEDGFTFSGFYKSDNTISLFTNRAYQEGVQDFLRSLKARTSKRTLHTPKLEEAVAQRSGEVIQQNQINWHDPKSIVAYLDQYVIGQKHAKKAAAVAFSNYMLRKETEDESLPKDCLLFLGPTGSGKTFIMKLLAEAADVPYAKASLSGKASEGYVGHRLSDVFKQIRDKTKDEAPYGIIFLDELDKIAMTSESFSNGDYGPKLQQEMIGWLEGDKINLTYYNDAGRREALFDTKNILFVMAGAFHGPGKEHSLENIIAKRLGQEKRIGFGASESREIHEGIQEDMLSHVLPRDLIDYGLKPELVGRITTRATLHELTTEDKIAILKRSKDSVIRKYARLFIVKGYTLNITDDVLQVIVEHCPQETGARELNTICSDMFLDVLYDPENFAKEKTICMTPKLAQELLSAHGEREAEEQHATASIDAVVLEKA